MKKLFFSIMFIISVASLWAVWEGNGGIGIATDFPQEGLFARSDMFPKHTLLEITNLEKNITARAVVVGQSGIPGLLLSLSPELGSKLSIDGGRVVRMRVVTPSPVQEIGDDGLGSSSTESMDLDSNPALFVASETNSPNSNQANEVPQEHPSKVEEIKPEEEATSQLPPVEEVKPESPIESVEEVKPEPKAKQIEEIKPSPQPVKKNNMPKVYMEPSDLQPPVVVNGITQPKKVEKEEPKRVGKVDTIRKPKLSVKKEPSIPVGTAKTPVKPKNKINNDDKPAKLIDNVKEPKKQNAEVDISVDYAPKVAATKKSHKSVEKTPNFVDKVKNNDVSSIIDDKEYKQKPVVEVEPELKKVLPKIDKKKPSVIDGVKEEKQESDKVDKKKPYVVNGVKEEKENSKVDKKTPELVSGIQETKETLATIKEKPELVDAVKSNKNTFEVYEELKIEDKKQNTKGDDKNPVLIAGIQKPKSSHKDKNKEPELVDGIQKQKKSPPIVEKKPEFVDSVIKHNDDFEKSEDPKVIEKEENTDKKTEEKVDNVELVESVGDNSDETVVRDVTNDDVYEIGEPEEKNKTLDSIEKEEPVAPKKVEKTPPAKKEAPKNDVESFKEKPEPKTFSASDKFTKGKLYIQLAVYKDKQAAGATIDKYSSQYPLFVEQTEKKGRIFYTVFIGPVQDEEAGAVIERFKKWGYKGSFLQKAK